MTAEILTLRAFHKRPGVVMAPVSVTAEMSEYVQVSKKDLIETLRHYRITHVEIIDQDGMLLFQGGTTEEGHYL